MHRVTTDDAAGASLCSCSSPPALRNPEVASHIKQWGQYQKIGWSSAMADFMSFPAARERVLTCGDTTIGIIPDICLVSHFQVGPWSVLYRPTETGNVKRWGLPLMIPNFSRLKDGIFKDKNTTLPIHGFGRVLPWTVTGQETTRVSMPLN